MASGYQRQLKAKKGEASCTCSDPRGSSTMVKQGAADASQKPIDPSSLSITEALAGTFVATVFEFVQLNTVTPKVLNDARPSSPHRDSGVRFQPVLEGRITVPVMGSFTAGAAPGSPGGAGSAGTEPKPQHTIPKCALGETLCAPRRAATLSGLPLPAKSSGRLQNKTRACCALRWAPRLAASTTWRPTLHWASLPLGSDIPDRA